MKRARFAFANMSEMNRNLVKDSRVVSARSFLRTWAVFPMVGCLLAIGLPVGLRVSPPGICDNPSPQKKIVRPFCVHFPTIKAVRLDGKNLIIVTDDPPGGSNPPTIEGLDETVHPQAD